jgi:hypothetical protein
MSDRTVPEPPPADTHDRPARLTVDELVTLADLLTRLHVVADEADLAAVEAVSRLVNRALFRRWAAGDVPPAATDVDTGGRL